jgi:hypothetical protein
LEWLKVQLWHPAKRLLVSFTQEFLNVVSQWNQRVQIALSIKAWHANLITVVQSIKAALISVLAKALLIGSQLATTVRLTLQHAVIALSQKKDRLVEYIKWALSRLKENKIVQMFMARLLIQVGLRFQGAVRQLLQRVKQAFKKGK